MQNQISIVPNIIPIVIANQINPKIQQNYLYPLSSPKMLQENKIVRRFQSPAQILMELYILELSK